MDEMEKKESLDQEEKIEPMDETIKSIQKLETLAIEEEKKETPEVVSNEEPKKKNRWVWLLLSFALLGVLGYTVSQNWGSMEKMLVTSTPTPTPEPTPLPTPTPTIHPVALDKLILDYLEEEGYDTEQVSFVIEDLVDDKVYKYREKEYYIAASTYKLPLTMLWMDKINKGEYTLEDTLPYTYAMYEEGGPIGWSYEPGSQIDLKTIIEDTIEFSDNSGGHILFESLGGWNDYKEQASKYCPIKQEEIFFSDENVFNAEFMSYVLKRLYENQEDYKLILDAMYRAQPEAWLNSVLPKVTRQKYGNYDYYGHSVGLVLEGHPYTIAIYTEYGGYASYIIGHINAICYEYFNGKLPKETLEPDLNYYTPVEETPESNTEEWSEEWEETPYPEG